MVATLTKPPFGRFRHKFHNLTISLKAMPNPVKSGDAVAEWLQNNKLPVTFNVYDLVKIVLPFGGKTYDIQPGDYEILENGIRFTLPERCLETSSRQQARYECDAELLVTVSQNFLCYRGHSLNFSPKGMFVDLEESAQIKLTHMDEDSPAILTVSRGEKTFLQDKFPSKKEKRDSSSFTSYKTENNKKSSKMKRGNRMRLTPAPCLVFTHPFTNRCHNLQVKNISALGMAVEESGASSVLLPGLLIHDAQLYIGTTPIMTCLLKVVYSNQREK